MTAYLIRAARVSRRRDSSFLAWPVAVPLAGRALIRCVVLPAVPVRAGRLGDFPRLPVGTHHPFPVMESRNA